jgi:hypothetical protein
MVGVLVGVAPAHPHNKKNKKISILKKIQEGEYKNKFQKI